MSSRPLSLTLLASVARALPPSADAPVAGAVGLATPWFAPERYAGALANARALFPSVSPQRHRRLARRACAAYARFLIEYLRAQADPERTERRTELVAPDTVRRALDEGRGAVICTAHVTNWEIGALALRRLGRPVHVIAHPQFAAAWRDAVRTGKRDAGIGVSTPDDSPRALLRHLKNGGIVGVLIDGDGYVRGMPARLAGRTVLLPSGPAMLAARTGAVLAAGIGERTDPYGFRVRFEALADTDRTPSADTDRLHAALAAWLERTLREHPGGWCLFRPFFGSESAPAAIAALPRVLGDVTG